MGKLQVRRGNKADLPNPLSNGEPGWASDTGQLYMGTGVANENVFIGGNPPSEDYEIYVDTNGDTAANGATGLSVLDVAADDVGGTTDTTNIWAGTGSPFLASHDGMVIYNSTRDLWSIATYVAADHITCNPAITGQDDGDSIHIVDAFDNIEDAYNSVPASFSVNIALRISSETPLESL